MSDLFNIDLIEQGRPEWRPLAGSVAAGLAGAVLIIMQARLLASVIARVFLAGDGLAQVTPALVWLLGISAGRAGFVFLAELLAYSAARRVKTRLRQALYTEIQARGPAYTRGQRTGALTTLAQNGIEALEAYYRQYLPGLALAGLVPLLILAAVLPLDPLTALILLVTAPLIPFFMILIGKTAERLTRRQWTALNRLSAHFLDTLQGLQTLKLLGRSREHAGSIEAAGERYRATTMEVLRLTFLSALALELLATLSVAIVAVQIGLRLLQGGLEYEGALAILILAPEVFLPLRTLGLRFHAGAGALPAGRQLLEILYGGQLAQPTWPEVNAAQQASDPASIQISADPDRLRKAPALSARAPFQHIVFDRVSYSYPGSERPALDNVSFELAAGEQIALVGQSGAGKSTLAALLLRFFEPGQGQIRVDGAPLGHIPADEWRKLLAWVPQQPHLFQGTLAENLRLARPDASLAELETAARQARLLDWIARLPLGWDTPVGEGGSLVSGGQAQRIALARAFLKDAPLLLLDEPTAHLDPRLEEELRLATQTLLRGRTALTIAHRLSTIRQADRILVLEDGVLVESGRHADLLAAAGLYARLARLPGQDAWQAGPGRDQEVGRDG